MLWQIMELGCFISVEGIDGCGKSTQVQKIAHFLRERGLSFLITREPGGTPLAETIREMVLSPGNTSMHERCELLLYLAARAQHIEEKIRPALEQGIIVLCDRFQEATYAYQGYGRGLPLSEIQHINEFTTGGLKPTRTYIFDISVATALSRMQVMGKTPDRIENNAPNFFQKIRDGYLALAEQDQSRIKLINGECSIDDIFRKIKKDLLTFL